MCRAVPRQAQLDDRLKPQPWPRDEGTVQLIYAHLPPAAILAAGQHLRAQTNIEQRAHQLWFARGYGAGDALADWIRAECEVVQNLCQALLSRSSREPEPNPDRQ
jgi:hypothetical protein